MIDESSDRTACRSVDALAVAFVSRCRTRPASLAGIRLRAVDRPHEIDPSDDVVLFYGVGMAPVLRQFSAQAQRPLPPAVMLAPSLDWDDVRLALDHGAVGYLLENRYAFLLGEALLCAASTGGSILDPEVAAEQVRRAARARAGGCAPVTLAADRAEGAEQPGGGEGVDPSGVGDSAPRGLLSPREREVMTLLAAGLAVREVAGEMCLAEKTVRHHLSRIYGKLEVRGQSEALLRWLGLLDARRSGVAAESHTDG